MPDCAAPQMLINWFFSAAADVRCNIVGALQDGTRRAHVRAPAATHAWCLVRAAAHSTRLLFGGPGARGQRNGAGGQQRRARVGRRRLHNQGASLPASWPHHSAYSLPCVGIAASRVLNAALRALPLAVVASRPSLSLCCHARRR